MKQIKLKLSGHKCMTKDQWTQNSVMLGMVQERRCHKLDTDTGLPAKECQSGD